MFQELCFGMCDQVGDKEKRPSSSAAAVPSFSVSLFCLLALLACAQEYLPTHETLLCHRYNNTPCSLLYPCRVFCHSIHPLRTILAHVTLDRTHNDSSCTPFGFMFTKQGKVSRIL